MPDEVSRSPFYLPVFRAVIPVTLTYVLAVIGLRWETSASFQWQVEDRLATNISMVLLFTVTHAVVPVFLYRVFTSVPLIRYFAYVHMGFWFGLPMVFLASQTGWLSLVAPLVNVATARKGTRSWVFLQYGSTSFALLLFLGIFHQVPMFPAGIAVVLAQSLLLVVLELLGRPWWVSEVSPPCRPTDEQFRAFVSEPPPRDIPVYYRRLKGQQMLLYCVGGAFGGFGTAAIPLAVLEEGLMAGAFVATFAVVGNSILFFTWRDRHRRLKILRHGIYTLGRVEGVHRTNVAVDNQRRYIVKVRHEVEGTAYVGQCHAYGPEVALARNRRKSKQDIAMLYDPRDPTRFLIAEPESRWAS